MRENGIGWGNQVLSALALMEEVIPGHCQFRLKGDKDAGPITEVEVLKINESGKIREIFWALFRNSGKSNGDIWKRRKK